MVDEVASRTRLKLDLTGRIFGRLTVLCPTDRPATVKTGKTPWWLCRCQCGTEKPIREGLMLRGLTSSCGCLQQELRHRGPMYRHGQTVGGRSPEHRVWSNMIDRCTRAGNDDFARYGARGIKVCDRWMVFENFLEDMGRRPSGMTLDRLNNDGPYCRENCRWTTAKRQARNRSSTRWVELDGRRVSLSELVEESGLNYETVRDRLGRGWSLQRALISGDARRKASALYTRVYDRAK